VAVGIRKLAGFLHGGMTSWRQEKRPVARIDRVPLDELDAGGLQILDVRERSEWDAGHIPGSHHTPWHDIAALPEGLDGTQPMAVLCASGQRAAVASSLLARAGAEHVIHVVDGGVPRWAELGHPIEK
jgi:hydroxyacylglutathione hydrolase